MQLATDCDRQADTLHCYSLHPQVGGRAQVRTLGSEVKWPDGVGSK
jgi:hypothetical protein